MHADRVFVLLYECCLGAKSVPVALEGYKAHMVSRQAESQHFPSVENKKIIRKLYEFPGTILNVSVQIQFKIFFGKHLNFLKPICHAILLCL